MPSPPMPMHLHTTIPKPSIQPTIHLAQRWRLGTTRPCLCLAYFVPPNLSNANLDSLSFTEDRSAKAIALPWTLHSRPLYHPRSINGSRCQPPCFCQILLLSSTQTHGYSLRLPFLRDTHTNFILFGSLACPFASSLLHLLRRWHWSSSLSLSFPTHVPYARLASCSNGVYFAIFLLCIHMLLPEGIALDRCELAKWAIKLLHRKTVDIVTLTSTQGEPKYIHSTN